MTRAGDILGRVVGALPGAAVGAAVGSVGGAAGAVLGAISGTVLEEVGADVITRSLSPRENRRVSGVILAASAAFVHNEQFRGQKVREDGFFDGTHSSGAEFVEGVLLTARDSYEEQKVPFLGNLLANVAINPEIDARTANTAIRLAEESSWLELVVLGVFDDAKTYPMPPRRAPRGTDWGTWSQLDALRRLLEPPRSLLKHEPRVGERGMPGYDLNLNAISSTSGGLLLSSLMELRTIDRSERDPVYATISSETDIDEEQP